MKPQLRTTWVSKAMLGLAVIAFVAGCTERTTPTKVTPTVTIEANGTPEKVETATFGSGCFWCTEAVFLNLKGVQSVTSGYSGGAVKNPTYEQICTGTTGHAEVIRVTFDPAVIGYKELLEVFFQTHDPTTLDRQGPDVGTQYRSVVFYHNAAQKELAEKAKAALGQAGVYAAPIVTQIAQAVEFYPAEDYHQNFYETNPGHPYCRAMIPAKLKKLREVFQDKVK